jgi:hypothetical protein
VGLVADETTEGEETLTVTLDADATATADVTVNDTSIDGGVEYTNQSADIGTATVAETLDASTDGFKFTDDATVLNNVEITGFTDDDIIEASNAVATDYSFTNTGADVSITFNNAGTLNTISLIGVVGASDLVFDEASFETAIGFDAFTIA